MTAILLIFASRSARTAVCLIAAGLDLGGVFLRPVCEPSDGVRFVFRGKMAVPQGHRYLGMTEQFADGIQGYIGHDEPAGEMMTAIVEPKIRKLCALNQRFPSVVDIGEPPASISRKHRAPLRWFASAMRVKPPAPRY